MGHLNSYCPLIPTCVTAYELSAFQAPVRSNGILTKCSAHRDLAAVLVLLDKEGSRSAKGGSTGGSPPARRTNHPIYLPFIVFWNIAIGLTLANPSSFLRGRVNEDVYHSQEWPYPNLGERSCHLNSPASEHCLD